MNLSIATDYAADKGDPEPYLKRIADAGFSHVHWCHQWNTDFVYSKWEIDQIQAWLSEYDLKMLDLHASVGPEKRWLSEKEYERMAGVDLVRNRIDMTAQLGGHAIVMHIPGEPGNVPVRRSLDELEPYARERGIRITIENGMFEAIEPLLDEYPSDYLGLCYDCGHGNMRSDGLERLDAIKDRLVCIHFHDNDGEGDQHQLPFMGTVEWERLASILAASAYDLPVQMEVSMGNSGYEDETEFLNKAMEVGTRIDGFVQAASV
jgi:sugar phosphate isomerase/epimerase